MSKSGNSKAMASKIVSIDLFTRGVCCMLIACAFYSLHLYRSAQQDPNYRSYCDINEKFNCFSVHRSGFVKFGGLVAYFVGESSMLNQPHQILGILLYSVLFLFSFDRSPLSSITSKMSLLFSLIASGHSTYLIYVLLFVLQRICLLGLVVSTGNYLLAIFTYLKVKELHASPLKRPNKSNKLK